MNSSKKCHLIPPDEQRCLWMAAGVLSYQLCDRAFDCDHCPLDAAMRRRFPETLPVAENETSRLTPVRPPEIPQENLKYSRNHWWMKKIDHGLVRLGIEADLAQALLAVKAIVFPAPLQRLCHGQTCVWVVMDGGTMPLEAPFDGIVRAVNHKLIDEPYLLGSKPFDDGWLCDMEVDDAAAESAGLLTADEARPRFRNDQARFVAALASALRGKRPSVGLTLADGGEKLQNLADILGPTRYLALLRQFFGWPRR